ncbi:MAG: branched-chain amino acid ABC transporter permease [Negativicutes bacterium]|nr:branched-chain amino acid ABC transporter permease [Negativicutes bacterium]
MSTVFIQVVINGILVGGFYALMGMGLNVIFGVMKIVNFCQGELLMIGMYITYILNVTFGLDPYVAIPIVAVVLFVIGGLIQRGLITPLLGGASDSNLIFMTVGLMMLMQNGALVAFKSDYRTIQTAYSLQNLNILGQVVSLPKLISFVVLLAVTYALFILLMKTDIGRKIRATSQNPLGARLVGINIKRIYIVTYGLSAALAGVAGALLLPFYFVYPMVGATFTLRAFVVVVLGGLGSIKGAFVGGIVLGLLETLGAFFVGPQFKDSVVFVTFILILIIRQKIVLSRR